MELRELKAKRILNGLTQEQLAKKIGINTKSYNMKENGKNIIEQKKLQLSSCSSSQCQELLFEKVRALFLFLD